MSTTSASTTSAGGPIEDVRPTWTSGELEDRLRAVAAERCHPRHPFNLRMHDGLLSPEELRRWILNRFHSLAPVLGWRPPHLNEAATTSCAGAAIGTDLVCVR